MNSSLHGGALCIRVEELRVSRVTDFREIALPRKRVAGSKGVLGAMACHTNATLALTQIHTTTSKHRLSSWQFPEFPSHSQIQLCATFVQFRPLLKISAPHRFGPKSNLTNLPEAERSASYKNLSIKDRMPMVVPPQRTQFRRDSWTKNVLAFIHDGCWERTRVNLLMKCWQKGRFWR